MKEPIGTITNVAFLVVAILIALTDGVTGTSALVASLTLLAIGSTAFHFNGSENHGLAHRADVASLYIVAGVVVYHAWDMDVTVLIVAMLVVGGLSLTIGKLSAIYPVVASAIIIAVGLIEHHGLSSIWLPIGLAAAGFAARQIGERMGKAGNSMMDDVLHGVWHILIAAAVYYAWIASLG